MAAIFQSLTVAYAAANDAGGGVELVCTAEFVSGDFSSFVPPKAGDKFKYKPGEFPPPSGVLQLESGSVIALGTPEQPPPGAKSSELPAGIHRHRMRTDPERSVMVDVDASAGAGQATIWIVEEQPAVRSVAKFVCRS